MSNFFKNFPLIGYSFGGNLDPVLFQNISAYVSLIDEIGDDTVYYNTITINDFERADTLSYKLYGTTDYYWTFFFLNNDIRESGWPVDELGLKSKAEKDYPNRTITTMDDIADTFLIGDTVTGNSSGTIGTVVKRYLDLGQIIVKTENWDAYSDGEAITPTPRGTITSVPADQINVSSEVIQYNSVHHYENSSGDWTDINPWTQDTTGLTPITYMDRIVTKNDDLREIKVFTEDVVSQINAEFQKLLIRN